jgi:hypothetical protein
MNNLSFIGQQIASIFLTPRDRRRKTRHIPAACVAFLLSLLFLSLQASLAQEQAPDPRASAAIAIAAQRLHVPEDELQVVHEAQVAKYASLKVVHLPTGRVEIVYLNPNNLAVPAARIQQVLATRERVGFHGKQEQELFDRAARRPLSELTTVLAWVRLPGPSPRIARSGGLPLAQSVSAKTLRDFHKNATRGLVEQAKSQGWTVLYWAQDAPVVVLRVPNDQLSVLEARDDVEALYLGRRYRPELNISTAAIDANKVWSRGFIGTGVKVAVVEVPDTETATGAGIYFGHSYLADGIYCNPSASPLVGKHATEVAGIIASTNTTYRGVAYGVPALLSANTNGTDADVIKCTEWAIDQGATVLNYSFGFDSGSNQFAGLDRYVDYVIRNRSVTIVKSAGNSSTPQIPVTSPGKGYNVLTVGNYNDVNTASNSDDVMSSTSVYGDPYSVYSDREKPEVVAPGVSINTTCISSTTCIAPDSGTSFAAPHVAGCAALLMQRNSLLGDWPESIRAVLMASAVVNIEGATRLSEIDGAGAIECDSADDIVSGAAGGEMHEAVTISSFPRDITFSATAGQTVRVVIAWDSTPSQPVTAGTTPASDPLNADLDLTVYSPNITVVASSNSHDNSYEIVEFTAATTGVYTARISAPRFDGASEYLGFAWWRGTRERN